MRELVSGRICLILSNSLPRLSVPLQTARPRCDTFSTTGGSATTVSESTAGQQYCHKELLLSSPVNGSQRFPRLPLNWGQFWHRTTCPKGPGLAASFSAPIQLSSAYKFQIGVRLIFNNRFWMWNGTAPAFQCHSLIVVEGFVIPWARLWWTMFRDVLTLWQGFKGVRNEHFSFEGTHTHTQNSQLHCSDLVES